MRKLILLATFCFGTLLMSAQEISTQQWSIVTQKTADSCEACGQWGWEFNQNLLAAQQDKPVLIWNAHYAGELQTQTSTAILDNLPTVEAQPTFFLNNDIYDVNEGNFNTQLGALNDILDAFGSFDAFAGVGSTAIFDGTKITNTSKVRFLVDLEADEEGGQYWLASYLVSDELIAFQEAIGDNAVHQNLIIASFNGEEQFGINFINGSVLANQEFTTNGELDFSGVSDIPDFSEGHSVVTVLWSRIGNTFVPFNLNRQAITSESSSTNDVLSNVSVTAFHLGSGQIDMNITSDAPMNDASVTLIDINGRTIASKSNVDIIEGNNKVLIETQDLTLGTYIVNIQSKLGSKSLKISVR